MTRNFLPLFSEQENHFAAFETQFMISKQKLSNRWRIRRENTAFMYNGGQL